MYYTRERFQSDCRKAMTLPKGQQAKALRVFQIRIAREMAAQLPPLDDDPYGDAYDDYIERVARTFGCESYDKMMLSLWD